jgi:hypothetical protein
MKTKSCHLCKEESSVVPVLLKGNETQRWREKLLDIKQLHLHEEIAHKNIFNCNQKEKYVHFYTK